MKSFILKISSVFKIFNDQANVQHLFKVLGFTSFIFGFSYAYSLLYYNGKRPVNVAIFLIFFIFLQLTFLLFSIIGQFLSTDKSPPFLSKILFKFLGFLGAEKSLLSSRSTTYHLAFFGVFFSLGGIIALLIKTSFTDLVFGWSTSLPINSKSVHHFTSAFCLPWSFVPRSCPDIELLSNSQYFRINNNFSLSEVTKQKYLSYTLPWMKFLIGAIVTYGIIPRVIIILTQIFNDKDKEILSEDFFDYDSQNIESLFRLSENESHLFYSLQAQICLRDIDKTKPSVEKDQKLNWFSQWSDSLTQNNSFSLMDETSIFQTLIRLKKDANIKALISLCELSTFTPYYDLGNGSQLNNSFHPSVKTEFLKKVCSTLGQDYSQVQSFQMIYTKELKSKKMNKGVTAIIGVAILGAIAVAVTGGAGAIAVSGAMGKALGLAGMAAKTTGLALLGGGILLASGLEKEGQSIFIGCGAILGGMKNAVSSTLYMSYLNSDYSVLRDLQKLKSYIEVKFFNEQLMKDMKPSLKASIHQLIQDIEIGENKEKENLIKYCYNLLDNLNKG